MTEKAALPPLLLIGNPSNRRVQLFAEALARSGQPPPRVLAHGGLLRSREAREAIPDEPHIVRLESVGEEAAVERGLLALGYEQARQAGVWRLDPQQLAATPQRHGEILCPRQHHFGFLRYLERLQELFARRPRWRLLTSPQAVVLLFDKRALWQRHRALGLPVPDALQAHDADALRAAMRERGWESVFVKLTCGSSASCLALYRYLSHRSGRGAVITSMRRTAEGWFNSLELQRYTAPAEVDAVLDLLLREGSHIERQVPKARLERAFVDCRVLVVDGEAAFVVVRQSHHPITNLHLGGRRGDLDGLRRSAGSQFDAALESCLVAARAHGCFQLGVDVMFERGFGRHYLLEANAFGDLLPNLERDGRDVYGHQIERLLRPSAEASAASPDERRDARSPLSPSG